jgi:type I restriction enzyme S subunit
MELTPSISTNLSGANPQTAFADWRLGRIVPMPPSLPSEWKLVRLTSVAELESGHTPSRRRLEYWNGGIPWLSLLDVAELDHPEIFLTSHTISSAGLSNSSARLLPAGTVVFSRTATVGKCTVAGRQMATSQDFANYICGPELHNRYLLHLLRFMAPEWHRLMAGSTHNSIYMPVFQHLQILLPPIREQSAIAESLDDVEALIESLETLIAKKRQLKQGAMQELLSGRRRLRGFDGEWSMRSLRELFEFSGGIPVSRDQLSTEGHCYLHYGDIHTSERSFIDVSRTFQDIPKLPIALGRISPNSLLKDGDVVFVDASEDEEGASRYVVILNEMDIPFIAGLHTIVAKTRAADFDHGYLRYCFQAQPVKDQFRFYAVGTKVLGVSKSNIGKIVASIPPKNEQAAIAAVLIDMDAEIESFEARLAKTRALKQGMMQQLLTGRIRLPIANTSS